jgi:tol-pal system protein YbgF
MNNRVLSQSPVRLALGFALTILCLPTYAFPDDEARKAILDLRQQMQQQTAQNVRVRMQLADQIQALQQQITQLQAQVELATHQQQTSVTTPVSPSAANNARQTEENAPQEQTAYDGAIELFHKGQYKEAIEALTAFIALYPHSIFTPTAQFYLGSSHYAIKDFRGAITPLQTMVAAAPNHARAPDALLVIAGSQVELNHRTGAKTTLQRIVRQYPSTPAAETARNRLRLLP